MAGRIAPIGDGRIIVDADRVDVRIGPKRVEREADLGAPVDDVGAVLGPVGRVGEASVPVTEHSAQVGRERAQGRDGRDTSRARSAPASGRTSSEPITKASIAARRERRQTERSGGPAAGSSTRRGRR